jgi:DNA-binding MarR family transcriptional regulator
MQEGELIGGAAFELASLFIRQRPRNISLTAASTLDAVARTGPRRLGDLAINQGITQPSMTALVRQLAELGLVERRADPEDGRVVLVVITPAGRRHLADRRRAAAASFSALLGQLSAEEIATLVAAVPAINHLLDLARARPLSKLPTAR